MKFNLLLSTCLWIALSISAHGQSNPFAKNIPSHNGIHRCFSDQIAHEEYNTNPSFRFVVDNGFSQNKSNNNANAVHRFADSIVRIPVVFHVIHNGGAENIALSQIESQIRILNEDFRRIPGTNGFGPGVDTKIEFFLAQKDPNGNCTDGVVRVQSSLTNHTPSQAAQLKALSWWDNTRYLNFWVVNTMGGVLGYATFPGGTPALDGIVCADEYVGDEGTSSGTGPYGLGRTATHEIGHWLELFHTFQGGCTGGDQCADTPPVDNPNFGCATGHVSCGNVDQVENYMDYSDDPCFDRFTADQLGRMNSALTQFRSLMLDSMNAINAGLYGCLGITYCNSEATDSTGTEIRNVNIESLNNSSANNCTGYSDYTTSFPLLTQDSSYTLSVTTGHCTNGTAPNHEVKAYIDWDRNGSFADIGEEYLVKANGPAGTGTVTITVPSNAPLDRTGMRVIATDGGVTGPCASYLNGETEDYAIQIQAPPPSITSFSPTSGTVNSIVFIVGENFTSASEVKFNNTATSFFIVLSDDSIRVNVPFGSTTGPITVTSPTGSDVSAGIFTITTPQPAITNFTPQSGPVGTSVLIFGSNLGTVNQVRFNGVVAPGFNQSGNQVTVNVPTGATTGKIEIDNNVGTAQSANNFVVTFPPVSAGISGTATICDGNSSDLSINLAGTPPFDIVYTDGSNNFSVNNVNGPFPLLIPVSPSIGATTYTIVSVIDQNDTITAPDPAISGSAVITVNANPSSGSLSGNSTICDGDTTSITFNVLGGTGPYDISINNGLGQINGVSDGAIITVMPSNTSTYSLLSLSDDNNCSTSNFTGSGTVNVNTGPDANFTSSINKSTVTFTDQSVGAVSWLWNFGDSTTSTQQNPVHIYSHIGIKNVKLTSTHSNGCIDEISKNILILETTGLSGLGINENISIFPNPAKNSLNIDLNLNTPVKVEMEIISIEGKKMINIANSTLSDSHKMNIDINELPGGIYIMNFTLSDGRTLNTKFYKN
ncbi:T9SS type A sorting domain-containing protein [Hyphobacterium sp. CCMP332]|nr:T9SS type A sorting domain-containing protein [Hyphobacterium sp. CCMP332]